MNAILIVAGCAVICMALVFILTAAGMLLIGGRWERVGNAMIKIGSAVTIGLLSVLLVALACGGVYLIYIGINR